MTRLCKAYDMVQAVLISVGIAIVVMLLINIPNMRDAMKETARQRALIIAHETSEHCERFGLKVGDHSHIVCVIEINRMRDDAIREATITW